MNDYMVKFEHGKRPNFELYGKVKYEPKLVKGIIFFETELDATDMCEIEGVKEVRSTFKYSISV